MATRPARQNIFKQLKRTVNHPMCYRAKFRVTVAEINAGAIAIPAPVGGGVRLHDIRVTATSGTGAGGDLVFTGKQGKVDTVLGTFPPATLIATGITGIGGATVVASGVFMNLCDSGQPIRIGKSGANITGIGGLDVSVLYSIE
jgi:hypothetical protein